MVRALQVSDLLLFFLQFFEKIKRVILLYTNLILLIIITKIDLIEG